MPKKTKKEKLLAMYHKKLRSLEKKDVTHVSVNTSVVTNKIKSVESEPVNRYFYSDLWKSILLIVLILGIEVSLYFAKLIK